MTDAAKKPLEAANALPEDERLALASELIASVDGLPDGNWEPAWLAELDRRVEAALEEELAGFGVLRKQVGLVVDELQWAAVVRGGGLAGVVVGDPLSQIRRVAGVEVAVLDASEDVDAVDVFCVSDVERGGCPLLGCLLASAIRTAGPVKSALRARPRASHKGGPFRPAQRHSAQGRSQKTRNFRRSWPKSDHDFARATL